MSFFTRFKTSTIIGGTGIYLLGCYGAYSYTTNFVLPKTKNTNESENTKPIRELNSVSTSFKGSSRYGISEEDRLKLFDDGAFAYDDDIGTDEIVMGLTLIRRWLVYGVKDKSFSIFKTIPVSLLQI